MLVVKKNYSISNDLKCKLDTCKTVQTITDFERGEVVCGGCGTLLMQQIDDSSYESGVHLQQNLMMHARINSATSLAMYDRGLSTVIGVGKDSSGTVLSNKVKNEFNRLRMWDQRSKTRKMANLSKAFSLLYAMKTKLGIPNNVVENAAYIYRKIVSAKLTRGRTRTSLIAAALYAACRENNIPRTLNDIAKAGNVEKKILARDLRTIVKRLELHLEQYDTASFISKISNNMNLREKTKRDALNILKRCEEERITAGKHPMAQAAASLYISCIINDEKISQNKFAKETEISDVTIRNRAALIKNTLDIFN